MKSSLKVLSAVFLPKKGVVRKEDKELIEYVAVHNRSSYATKLGKTKEQLIDLYQGKLKKSYDVVIITDKQFGMIDTNLSIRDGVIGVATSKQKEQMFTIK